MKKTLKVALAALLATGVTQVAFPQVTFAAPADQPAGTAPATGATTAAAEADGYTPFAHNGLNISGQVGLPLNPTANIPNAGGVRLQGNFYELIKLSESGVNARLRNYGIYAAGRPWKAPVEVSLGFGKLDASSNDDDAEDFFEELFEDNGVAIGAKWQFWRNSSGDLFVAVGAGYNRALYKNLHAYLVATKAFNVGRRPIWAHLGVRHDEFEVDAFGVEIDSKQASIYGGLEVPIDRKGRWIISGELQSKNADDSGFNDFLPETPYSIALRYQNPRGFAASIGWARQGTFAGLSNELDVGGRGSGPFAQIGWAFGGVGE